MLERGRADRGPRARRARGARTTTAAAASRARSCAGECPSGRPSAPRAGPARRRKRRRQRNASTRRSPSGSRGGASAQPGFPARIVVRPARDPFADETELAELAEALERLGWRRIPVRGAGVVLSVMLRTWHEDLESLEAIKQDELTRDLVLRMAALSQAGKLGRFLSSWPGRRAGRDDEGHARRDREDRRSCSRWRTTSAAPRSCTSRRR